jgi:glycerophosphoryl diester phosphodiesterase
MVAAHRGVATGGAAENSIEAFTNAIDVGADMTEFDVRITRDGEMIAFHNRRVKGVPVGRLTRDDIAAATGVRPALVTEVLHTCAGNIKVDLELKEDGYVPAVMAALRAIADPDEVVVTSFLPAVVAQAKTAFPEVRTGLLFGGDLPFPSLPKRPVDLYPVDLARKVRADYLGPHYSLARFGTVRRAAEAGLPCLPWTVNSDSQIRAFAADPSIAIIITDNAERALAIVDRAFPGPVPSDVS